MDGKNNLCLITYLEDLKRREVPIFAHENLKHADIAHMVRSCMADEYDIQQVLTRPVDVGYGSCKRDRAWLVGVHKKKARWLQPSLQGLYEKLCEPLSARQVPQAACWCETDAEELKTELEKSAHPTAALGHVEETGRTDDWLLNNNNNNNNKYRNEGINV